MTLSRKILREVIHLLTDEYLQELGVALECAMKFKEDGLSDEEICAAAKSIPILNELLNLRFPDYELTSSVKELGSHPRALNIRLGADISTQGMLATAIKEIRENQWFGAHRDAILKEYEVVRNRRLMTFMEKCGYQPSL